MSSASNLEPDISDQTAVDASAHAATRERCFVVGIGASAGGLEALQRLVTRLQPTGQLCFIVIQHLSPDFKSLMDELLIPHTELKVCRATDGAEVQPDTIYLMPPKHEMVISGGRLCLTEREPGKGLFLPIDTFFRSLGEDLGSRSVAVVLSGTGSDGSRGLRAVHEAGGLVIAQSEQSAKFEGMPRSAVDTGVVDLVLPPEEIADAVVRYAERDGQLSDEDGGGGGKDALHRIFALLQRECGIDFADYKDGTVGRRIERRLLASDSPDLEAYVRCLERDPGELRSLYKDLLIGVTRFFRDAEAFARLRAELLPHMVDRLPPNEEMRVWVPGCATGEEPYSLAMVISEAFRQRGRTPCFRIFATDVHRASLELAGAGRFSAESLASIPRELTDRYFEPKHDCWQIRTELRERVVFAHHNVLRDAPFTRLDLLSCRNLLIYFKAQAQRRLLALFHFALKPSAILVLGPSETPGPLSEEFAVIDPRWKMFRKLRDVRLAPDITGAGSGLPTRVRPAGGFIAEDERVVKGRNALLKRFLPPSVVVDDSFRILQSYNGAGEFLVPRDGEPSLNVLDLLEGEMRVAVAAALRRAQKEGGHVSLGSVNVMTHRGARRVRVSVEPVEDSARPNDSWVVAFQPDDVDLPALARTDRPGGAADEGRPGVVELLKERVAMLENELRATRESLQTTVEEMETNNEELQATNEELIASNEELQSTNEELNSVNEELYTVNAEYQAKIAELTELTADMNNLLESTEVHTLFLDRELRVRKFTPKVGETFNLMPQDVGRRFESFSHTLKEERLLDEVRAVFGSGTIVEREVRDGSGRLFFLRILPYRTAQGIDGGVVLTLIDISALRRAQERLAASEERYRTLVRAITAILWSADGEGNFAIPQPEWEAYTGYGWEQHRGRGWLDAIHPEDRDRVRQAWERAVTEKQPFTAEGRLWNHQGGSYHYFVARAAPLPSGDGSVREWVGHVVDVHDSRAAELEVRKKDQQIRAILERSPVFIYLKDLEGRYLLAGNQCASVIGRGCDDVVGKTDYELLPRAIADELRAAERKVIETGEPDEDEVVFETSGEPRTFVNTRFPLRDEQNLIYAVAGIFTDVTERKRTAEEAQQALDRRDRFLAMLSHELRTPLGAILNASSLLDRQGNGLGAHERDIITRQARHMAKLIEDLLDVGRITREHMVIEARLLDLRSVLNDVLDTERLDAEKAGITLAPCSFDALLPVRGDPVRLRQIFVNLVSNCITYAPGGTVTVTLRRDGDQAIVEVRDSGVGMTEEELGRVFEIFYQAPQTIDRPRGGLGVGLTLARQLARLHGGDLTAHSDGKAKGSAFVVTLPLVANLEELPSEPVPQPATVSPLRIAVVEDNQDIRDTLEDLLRLDGHEVLTAEDGVAGLRLILEHRPDVALVDLGLPAIDGFELARLVRSADNGSSRLCLVALTGYGREEDRAAAAAAGFDHHLIKPVEQSVLTALLATLDAPDAQRTEAAKGDA